MNFLFVFYTLGQVKTFGDFFFKKAKMLAKKFKKFHIKIFFLLQKSYFVLR